MIDLPYQFKIVLVAILKGILKTYATSLLAISSIIHTFQIIRERRNLLLTNLLILLQNHMVYRLHPLLIYLQNRCNCPLKWRPCRINLTLSLFDKVLAQLLMFLPLIHILNLALLLTLQVQPILYPRLFTPPFINDPIDNSQSHGDSQSHTTPPTATFSSTSSITSPTQLPSLPLQTNGWKIILLEISLSILLPSLLCKQKPFF